MKVEIVEGTRSPYVSIEENTVFLSEKVPVEERDAWVGFLTETARLAPPFMEEPLENRFHKELRDMLLNAKAMKAVPEFEPIDTRARERILEIYHELPVNLRLAVSLNLLLNNHMAPSDEEILFLLDILNPHIETARMLIAEGSVEDLKGIALVMLKAIQDARNNSLDID